MNDLDMWFQELVASKQLHLLGEALIILVFGMIFSKSVAKIIEKSSAKRLGKQSGMISGKLTFYTLVLVVFFSTLNHIGIDIKVLLGAASVFTVAIGFASKTATSNLISGLFLLGERPFVIGDRIRVGDTEGEVISIDLLSSKLRGLDNMMYRIPNELLLNSKITNITHFPIRRVEIFINISFEESIERVKKVLMQIADENPHCLDNPVPLFIVMSFEDSSIKIKFGVWTKQNNYILVKNELHSAILSTFEQNGIQIPFPVRVIQTAKEGNFQNSNKINPEISKENALIS